MFCDFYKKLTKSALNKQAQQQIQKFQNSCSYFLFYYNWHYLITKLSCVYIYIITKNNNKYFFVFYSSLASGLVGINCL